MKGEQTCTLYSIPQLLSSLDCNPLQNSRSTTASKQDVVLSGTIPHLEFILEIQSNNLTYQGNPYTTKPFDYQTIFKANKVIDYLKNNNISVDFIDEMKELVKDKKKILKHKMIDVFASIERLGLSFNNEWFTSLNLNQLKKLYGLMEDIWNYRAELTITMKMLICPPTGIIFNISHLVIRGIDSRDKLREFIIDDINKFNSALSDNDKKTGLIYFLIGLSQVNPLVFNTHPWILNAL